MLKADYDTVRKKAKQQLKIAQKATDTPEGTDLSDEYKGVSDYVLLLRCTEHLTGSTSQLIKDSKNYSEVFAIRTTLSDSIPFGRKPEYQENTHDFRQSVD